MEFMIEQFARMAPQVVPPDDQLKTRAEARQQRAYSTGVNDFCAWVEQAIRDGVCETQKGHP
jgi:hypothetical protein